MGSRYARPHVRKETMPRNNQIILHSRREVWITEINQELTYNGLLEGLPTTQGNKRQIEGLLKACHANARTTPVKLLVPREKPIKIDEPYALGTPAALPSVTCVAKLRSKALEDDDRLAYSELILVWFQDELAMPIDETALAEILQLDWENLAGEFEL